MPAKQPIKIIAGLATLAAVSLALCCFTVSEGEVVVITQLGRVVRVEREPGLKFKAPQPLQSVLRFSTKLAIEESVAAEMLTGDKKNLLVNTYTVWRIGEPLAFFKTFRDSERARHRIDDLVRSETRNAIGMATLSEIITQRRAELSARIAARVKAQTETLGIEIVDVKIKRVFFPRQNLASVYQRMQTERQNIATKYRSEGKEEATKIIATAEKEKTIILAEGYREAQRLRGQGEAAALHRFAAEVGKDVEFYRFIKAMESYPRILGSNATLVVPYESELFRHLQTGARP